MLGCVFLALFNDFQTENHQKILTDLNLNQIWGDLKTVNCFGNTIVYSNKGVAFGTIEIPSSNGLRWNVTEIALFVYSTSYRVSVWRQQSSHLHVLLIF